MSVGCVLDASALLALLHREPGADAVAALLPASAMTTVNWSEVVQKARAHGVQVEGMAEDLRGAGLALLPFDVADAEATADLWSVVAARRLSLADRACMAAAQRLGVPAVTADRSWTEVGGPVEVQLIR